MEVSRQRLRDRHTEDEATLAAAWSAVAMEMETGKAFDHTV